MKVLITGIDGFTGIYLESLLIKEGFSVYGTVISGPTNKNHFKCDIRNASEVNSVINKISPEYLFHLAGISFVGESDKSLFYDVNVIGTQNILEALLGMPKAPKKVIVASSATVYGNQNKSVLDESLCPKPVNHYGNSKLSMEHLVATYFNKLNILITRPFNYTGPGHSENFIIPKIVNHFVDNKKSIELGNLDVAREFNDIRSIIDMYYKLMKSDVKSEIVNLCTGNLVKLKDVIKYMESIVKYKIEVKINPLFLRKNEIPSLMGSTNKLSNVISIDNTYTIIDTLKLMYSDMKKND